MLFLGILSGNNVIFREDKHDCFPGGAKEPLRASVIRAEAAAEV